MRPSLYRFVTLTVALALTGLTPARAEVANPAAVDAMQAYLDFVDYGGATIWPEQIPAEEWKNFFVIDARDADQYQKDHIPGSINIEWRQVLARRAELPTDKPVLIYCNSGSLSAQAGFALRVAGMD